MKNLKIRLPNMDKMFVTVKYLENTKSTKSCMCNIILSVLQTTKAFHHFLTLRTMEHKTCVSEMCTFNVHISPKIRIRGQRVV